MAVRGDVIVAIPRSNCSCLSWALENTVYAGCAVAGNDSSLLLDAVLLSLIGAGPGFSCVEISIAIIASIVEGLRTSMSNSCRRLPHYQG